MPRKAAILERDTWLAFLQAPYPAGHPPRDGEEHSIVSVDADFEALQQRLFAHLGGMAGTTDDFHPVFEISHLVGGNTG
jgi:hypothetical protein